MPPSTAQPGCASEVQTVRRLHALLAILAFALCAPALFAAPQDDEEYSNVRIVRLSFVNGDAKVFRPEEGEWEQARQNLPIQKAYAVATGRGRVEIEFESGGTARLDEFSELEFTELALLNGARITTLRLERGSAVFYANGEKRDVFEVIAGDRRVKADRNARFRMDANGSDVLIAVLKGNVDVESEVGTQRLTKNQEMRISVYGVDIARHGDADEFEQWAQDRDEVLTASYRSSSQYVNASFRYGAGDLSNYGYWYHHPSYGNVWQPYSVGFTPYIYGSWIWVNGFGWSWVGYEPWGWLPYHFGHWVHLGYGWAWVPGGFHRWRPHHVTWVRFRDGRHGWCPRSPHDRPGRRPHNLGVGTVVWNGRNPVVRNVNADELEVLTGRPTRETLGSELGYGSRNPRIDRAGRGPHGRAPEAEGTVAGPRSGFSGATNSLVNTPRTPRGSGVAETTGRVPVSRGDVRYDGSEGRYLNTPVREGRGDADAPRSGWSGSASGGRPRPTFDRDDDTPGANPDGNRYRPSGTNNSGPRYGTTPSNNGSRGSGYSGRPSSEQPDWSPAPPPRSSGAQSGASRQPSYSPPRTSSPPPQRQPSYAPPPRSSSPPPSRPQRPSYSPPPRPSSPPPQVRQSAPPRPAQSSSPRRPN